MQIHETNQPTKLLWSGMEILEGFRTQYFPTFFYQFTFN